MPGLVKFTFVTAIVSAVCILTYNFLVRNTWVGLMLNGKKNPEAIPYRTVYLHGSHRQRISMEVLNTFSISMIIFLVKILSEIKIINLAHC